MGCRNDDTKRNPEIKKASDGLKTDNEATEPKGKKRPAAVERRRTDG
jgi:hypothetical protein